MESKQAQPNPIHPSVNLSIYRSVYLSIQSKSSEI